MKEEAEAHYRHYCRPSFKPPPCYLILFIGCPILLCVLAVGLIPWYYALSLMVSNKYILPSQHAVLAWFLITVHIISPHTITHYDTYVFICLSFLYVCVCVCMCIGLQCEDRRVVWTAHPLRVSGNIHVFHVWNILFSSNFSFSWRILSTLFHCILSLPHFSSPLLSYSDFISLYHPLLHSSTLSLVHTSTD